MTGPGSQAARRERGFALLVVLWTMSLLTLIVTWVVLTGRSESRLAANLRINAVLEAAADGAVHEAIYRLLDHPDRRGKIRNYRLHIPQGAVEIAIEDLGGRVGLNVAPLPLLEAQFQVLGVGEQRAADLAAAIVGWRTPRGPRAEQQRFQARDYQAAGVPYGPPNAPFRSLEEVGLVLGMTPALLAQLAPHVSVFQEQPPDPAIADPVVKRALSLANDEYVAPLDNAASRPFLAAIRATAFGADGARFIRRAVVRTTTAPDGVQPPFKILDWEAGDG